CGDLLVPWHSLAWDKTVQTLTCLLSIATRPGRCPHATCPGSRLRLRSAAAQPLPPPDPTDCTAAIVRLGRLCARQHALSPDVPRVPRAPAAPGVADAGRAQ